MTLEMKPNKMLIALFMLLTTVSCEENSPNDTLVEKPFEYKGSPSDLHATVNSVYFIDDMNGFAAGNGKVFKTTDGGLHWKADSLTKVPFFSIYFPSEQVGYSAGGESACGGTGCHVPGSVVYKTVDGGDNWEKLNIPYAYSQLNSVFFIDENIGFAVGLGLHIKTTDGGKTWQQFEFGYQGAMNQVVFVNSQTGFCAGLFGNIFRTSDQGRSWEKTNNASDGHIYALFFVNEQIGYAAGQRKIVKTTDGGATWKILPNAPSEIFFLHFKDEANGMAIGKGHYTGGDWGTWTRAIYRTHDGGTTWTMEDNIAFGAVASFFNQTDGYSVTRNETFQITYN
jgi:photosystem II stability/assembly factor-like uncharacterized protein